MVATTRLSLFTLAGCPLVVVACDGDESEPISVQFQATVGVEPAACGRSYMGLGADGRPGQLLDARWFVSDVELRGFDGQWVPLVLDQGSDWQHEGVALLDFEDGSAGCADSGTDETNAVVTGTAPADDYRGLRFTVGVPFELNHNDSATAPAPLNAPGMFWTWRGGYKFVRVDFGVSDGAVPRWNVHIGSTGCVSDADTAAPDEPCGRGNHSRIVLDDFDPSVDTAVFDLAALVAGADLAANVSDSPPGCMSSPMEAADCAGVFASLGIDFATGRCDADCAAQTAFTAAR